MPSKRKADARRKKLTKPLKTKRRRAAINFHELSSHQQATHLRAVQVLGRVRRGESLTVAARDLRISPRTVLNRLPKDFSKARGSRVWRAKTESDKHVRRMKIIGNYGMEELLVKGTGEASELVQYLKAVRKAVAHNDPTALAPFHGKRIGGRELITSLRKLVALADGGTLHFEDLYSDPTGGAQ